MALVTGYLTFKDTSEAEKICFGLLERRLIACANILPAHRALYRWKGKIEDASEVGVFVKTRSEHVSAVSGFLREYHSYEVPSFVTWPIEYGHPPFLSWINEQTSAEEK